MFERIIFISNEIAKIKISGALASNIMNMHIVFEDGNRNVLTQIQNIDGDIITVSFLGEFVNGNYVGGVTMKPSLNSKIRMITKEELMYLLGSNDQEAFYMGKSPLYSGADVKINLNDLFSNHMAIFGNTGSGKSYGVARMLQNVFENPNFSPVKSNFTVVSGASSFNCFFTAKEIEILFLL